MEGVVGTCFTESASIIPNQNEDDINLSHCCKIEETKGSASFAVDTENIIKSNLTNKENNPLCKPEGKGINLLSDCDDSFEVFLPLKKSSSQTSFESSKQPSGKQKVKKNGRTRACPYFSTKSIKKHFKSPLKSQEDKDLELALARSLLDVSGSSEVIPKNSSSNTLCHLNKKEENHFKLKKWTGKKDQKRNLKSLLSRRTSHERERIITQKLAIVLLESKETENNCPFDIKLELTSSLLEEILDKNSTLWELSKVSNVGLDSFYVGALSNFIEPILTSDIVDCEMAFQSETPQAASKKASVSQNNPEVSDNGNDSDPIVASGEEEATCSLDFGTKLDSLNILSNDWSGVFGDKQFSDVDVFLRTEIFPCHKVIFKARCPGVLNDVIDLYSPSALDWSQYPTKSAKTFLKYIYSGRTEDISELTEDERRLLSALAEKYKLDYLFTLLSSCTEKDLFYSQSTCSVPHDSPDCSQDSSKVRGSAVSCDSTKKEKKNVSEKKNHSEEHFLLDGPPIILTDSSSSSSVKCLSPEKYPSEKNENKLPNENRHFSVFSKKSLSPDLFDDSLLTNVSRRLLELKRKLSVQDDFSRKRVQPSVCNSPKMAQNIEKSPLKTEIVTVDSSPEETSSPELKSTPVRNIRQRQLSSSSVEDVSLNNDNFCDSGFHFNFDINEHNEPVSDEHFIEKNEKNILSNNHCQSPPICLSEDTKGTDSPPTTKKSSLEQYLHTSFPSFTEEIIDLDPSHKQLSTSTPTSTPKPSASKELTETPDQEVIIKDATPLANYSSMASPDLQSELSKYGLKKNLERNKAKVLLRYIYDQTHTDMQLNSEPSSLASSENEQSNEPKQCIECILNRTGLNGANEANTKFYKLKKGICNFLKSNNELFCSIVLFRLLSLKKVHIAVKDHGIHCTLLELRKILDDLGVFYRQEESKTNRHQVSQKKKRKSKKKYT